MRLRHLAPLLALAACSTSDSPGEHPLSRETHLVQYQTCSDLETDLKQMLTHEAWVNIDEANDPRYGYGYGAGGDAGAPGTNGASGGAGSGSGGRTEGTDYSGTNNQVAGVDEADIVKTDGYHIYVLNGNRLHIFGVPNFGDLTAESVTKIEGYPEEMLVDRDANRAVVISLIDVWNLPDGHPLKQLVGWQGDSWYWRIPTLTKLTVLDVSDHTKPQLVREVFFEGWYQTARKIDTTVRLAAYSTFDRPEMWNWWQIWSSSNHDVALTKQYVAEQIGKLQLSDLVPQMYVRTPDGHFVTNSLSTGQCQSFYRPTDSHARGIATIISFDLLGTDFFWDADHVVSNYPTFYESQNDIVLAEGAHDWWWYWWYPEDTDQVNIHVFDGSQAGHSAYLASGRVDGQLIDQFSIDENNGAIRVATTTGAWERWWYDGKAPTPESHVTVLRQQDDRFAIAGHVDGITPGDRLMTSRFVGDQAFLVTYQYVDPLVTIDLSDPTAPAMAGSLKVPGFSTYLQSIAQGKLLAIGYEGSPTWSTDVSMFDVSTFSNPKLQTTLPLAPQQGWAWSEATWDHKAFQYWGPKQLLAIPESNYSYDQTTGYSYLSKLQLVTVDPNTGLSFYGAIDHSAFYDSDPTHYWSFIDIRRSIFMGDYVYAISDRAVTAHRVSDLGQVAAQPLPGYSPGDYWWWW